MTDNEHIKPLDLSRYGGHTPGPWKRDKYAPLVVVGERLYGGISGESAVASCGNFNSNTDTEKVYQESIANARLIADAPLLLAEVRRLRYLLARSVVEIHNRDEGCPSPPDDGLAEEILDALRVLGEEGGEE